MMKRRLHPLYKRLMLLAIVIGPFFWLVLTEDGQWRTDTVLLRLLGKPELNLALERLSPAIDEATLRQRFPDLDLRCTIVPTPFGDRLCTAEIGTFNAIPSRDLVLYFAKDRLSAVKLHYRGRYHAKIQQWLHKRLGPPVVAADEATSTWPTDAGFIVARAGELSAGDEPAVLWLARAVTADRALP